MPRTLIALSVTLVTASPLAGQGAVADRIRYRPTWWDVPSLAAAGALAVVPVARGLPTGPAPCAPCDPSGLLAIDHAALHTFSNSANTASTLVLGGVALFSGLGSLSGATVSQVRGHVVVFANSLTWTLAATEWLKVLTHRSRPVLYQPSIPPAAAADVDNRRSLPSAHAALAFAAATTYLAIARRERLPHRTRNAIALFGSAVAVAALRVAAGQHFPTDVAAGAALGAGVGWLTAGVHPTGR
jgi:membrane-associated phospholipid phosphatase